MSFTDLEGPTISAIEQFATCREIVRLAFTSQVVYLQLHRDDSWHFRSLLIDGDVLQNPAAAFAAVETNYIVQLSACNAGTKFFFALPHISFKGLLRIDLTHCLLAKVGARAVSNVILAHGVQDLGVHQCFLSAEDLSYFQAVAHKLKSFSVSESRSGVEQNVAPALTDIIRTDNLEHLSLSGKLKLTFGMIEVIARHGKLRSLRILENSLLSDGDMETLCKTWCCNAGETRLKCLDFSALAAGGILTDTAGHAIASFLQAGAGITELRLAGQRMSSDALAACLNHGSALELVDFTGTNLDIARDYGPSSRAPVRSLLVGGCTDYCDGHHGVSTSLKCIIAVLPTLVVLNVSNANIDDDAVGVLCAAISTTSNLPLRVLDLSQNFITEDGVQDLLPALKQGQACLRFLDVGINSIGDDGCSSIGLALREGGALSSLSNLSLRANSISDIRDLCGLLPSSGLQMLDLRENLLVDRDVRLLIAAARKATGAITLQLAGNEISEEFWDDLDIVCQFTGSLHFERDSAASKNKMIAARKIQRSTDAEESKISDVGDQEKEEEEEQQSAPGGGSMVTSHSGGHAEVQRTMHTHNETGCPKTSTSAHAESTASPLDVREQEQNAADVGSVATNQSSSCAHDEAEHQKSSVTVKAANDAIPQDGQANVSVAVEDWQDCLDLLDWAENQIQRPS